MSGQLNHSHNMISEIMEKRLKWFARRPVSNRLVPAEVRIEEGDPAILRELHCRIQGTAPERVMNVRAFRTWEEHRDAAEVPDLSRSGPADVRHGVMHCVQQLLGLYFEIGSLGRTVID